MLIQRTNPPNLQVNHANNIVACGLFRFSHNKCHLYHFAICCTFYDKCHNSYLSSQSNNEKVSFLLLFLSIPFSCFLHFAKLKEYHSREQLTIW